MAGQRKTLGSLVENAPPAPAVPPVSRSDRAARADNPASPAEVPAPESPAKGTPAGDMTMRSWYMPKASADRLAALVDDLHFSTRLPKHLIMGALVNVVDRHRAEVEAEVRAVSGQ
jgi:hypothetical protein